MKKNKIFNKLGGFSRLAVILRRQKETGKHISERFFGVEGESLVNGNRSSGKSLRRFLRIAGCRLLMTGRKLFRFFFNTKLRSALSLVLIIALLTTTFFLTKNPFQSQADYLNYVNQGDWSGGASTTATITPSTATGWNQYYEKGTNITADASGVSVTDSGFATIDFTTDGNYTHEDATKTVVEGGVAKFIGPTTYPITPYYLTTSDTSQKDTSTWTDIDGVTLTQTTPTNTDLKYLVSFDGRTSWKYWDGTAWQTSTLADLQTNGMSKATLEGLSLVNWSSAGGFVAGTTATLDFAVDLSTTDSSMTPELDQIQIDYNYNPERFEGELDFSLTDGYIHEDSSKTQVSSENISLKYLGYTGIYPPAHSDTYVKATSVYTAGVHEAYFSTDPSLPVDGSWSFNNWLSGNGFDTNQRFHIDLGSEENINRIYYENSHHMGTTYPTTGVKNFTLWGSNDSAAFNELTYGIDTNWTQITGLSTNQFEQHVAENVADPKYIEISGNEASYRYYAFKFADNWGMSYMGFRHLELQKVNYPTTSSYVTTSDTSQKDTSAWLSVNGVVLTQTTPIGTDLKYLVSFDDRATWKYWDGSAWQSTTLASLDTLGMSKSTLEGISEANWSATGGFVAGTTTTLDFAVDLSTTDATVTPELDKFQINYIKTTEDVEFTTDGDYIQEDSVNGTDFDEGQVILHNSSTSFPVSTWDPVDKTASITISNNDRTASSIVTSAGWRSFRAVPEITSGKWYWEIKLEEGPSHIVGIMKSSALLPAEGSASGHIGNSNYYNYYAPTGEVLSPTRSSYGATAVANDIIGVTFNADDGQIQFFKNNVALGSVISGISMAQAWSPYGSVDYDYNQTINNTLDTLVYTPPSGFSTLYNTNQSYPVTPSYITTSDTSQINTSTWTDIDGVTLTQTTPTNTDLKYLVSFDGRTSWKYWDGTAWQTSTLADLQTNGMSKATLEGLSLVNWSSAGGFVAGTTDTLDFAVDLSTTDGSVTPELSNIAVTYTEGLISSKFDSLSTKNTMGGLTWDEDTTLPANSEVSLALRTASTEAGLDTASWSTIGVSTPSSLTTGCTKSGTTVTCDRTTIPDSMKTGNDDQWFQYKLSLTRGDSSPTITNINPIYEQDLESPTITSITSTTPGEHKTGDTINVTVNFSEDVTSATGLTLTLNTTDTVTIPAWSTKTSSVSGSFTAGSTETTALTVSSLTGTITDQPGNSTTTGNLENIPFTTDSNYTHEDATKTVVEGGVGKLKPFSCGTSTVQDIESNNYTTVEIGTQCWMGENMNVGTRIAGTSNQANNSIIEKYCYDNLESKCDILGGLYQWNEIMQYSITEGAQGICPTGWHIPTDAEQHTLENGLATGTCVSTRDGANDCDPAGSKLAANVAGQGWIAGALGSHASFDTSGYKALASGYRNTTGGFEYSSYVTMLWNSTESGTNSWVREINKDSSMVRRKQFSREYGFPVRCIQNSGAPTTYPTTPYYLTTSTGSQKNTSTWTDIDGVTLTQTTPAGTDLKYLVSFDGRTSWKYWNGTAWQTSTLADFQTNGMSKATLEAMTTANWSVAGGFSPGTLDFAVDLSTTDGSVTPQLDNIEIEYSTLNSTYTNSSTPTPPVGSNLADNASIIIENTAPTSTVSVPNGTQAEYSSLPEISGTASDNNTLDTIYVSILDSDNTLYWDGDSWEATQTWLSATGTTTWTYNSSSVVWNVDTNYTVQSKAVDQAGNEETPAVGKSFTYVNAAPTVSNVSATKTSTTVEATFDVTDDTSTETTVSMVYDSGATLSTAIDNTETTNLTVSDGTLFPTSGTVFIQHGTGAETRYEYISYTGKSGNTLTGITRATDGTLGYSHTTGTTVYIKAQTVTGGGLTANGTGKTLSWNPTAENNFYKTNLTIGVVSNDGASANKIGVAFSTSFIFDSTAPSIDTASTINALTTPAQLNWAVTDDTAIEMMVSLSDTFEGATWEAYSATPTITLATNPDTVYIKFRDSQNNTTADQIITTPNTPQSVMIQDVSSIDQNKWRLYTSWQIVSTPTPGFEAYRIYRSTTEAGVYAYQGSTASGDITVDYYADTVTQDAEYFYKIATEDSAGNISYYSDSVWGVANATLDAGEGGGGDTGDSTAPTIQTGPTATTTNNSATITWTTDETADSFIEYGTTTSYGKVFGNSTTGTSHSVTLENLSGGVTYHYRVRTRDLAGNLTLSADATFTTEAGGDTTAPTISTVTSGTPNPTNTTITWTTDENANSLIDFGTTAGVYTLTQGSSTASTTSHSVTLTSLEPSTAYYFRVKSTDSSGNQAVDDNSGTSYTFTTAAAPDTGDVTAPIISAIAISDQTDNGATITWTTDELSDSIIGFSQDETYTQEQGSSTLATAHSVTLTGLSPSSTYYFQVKSRDANGNLATTTNTTTQTFTTLAGEDTTAPTILSGPTSGSLTSTSAVITWTTDETSNSLVDFGTTTNSYSQTQGNQEDSLTSHSVTLTNLTPGVTYYYQVRSLDSSSNQVTSPEATFTTTSSPTISAVILNSNTDTTANISFTTSSASYGFIDYGTTTGVLNQTFGDNNTTNTNHSFTLTNLTPATQYFYKVRIKDIYGNYILDATEQTFTTNSGDSPTLNSFTSTTADGYYNQADTINIVATYSEAIASGSITLALDTGAEVTLTGTGTTLTGTYTVQAGENSTDLTVSRIVVQDVCDADQNCLTGVTLPATNIATASAIQVDTTNPTISSFSPTTSSTVAVDNFSYTLDETITSGTLTVTQTGGTADASSPHTYTLAGTDLTLGAHTSIDPTITLTNGSIYTFTLEVTDLAGNSTTETQTSVTYDTDSMTLNSFTSTTADNSYGPGSTINVTATYSKNITSGELTVTLDTGASVTLNTITTNTISGTYTVGATGSGENSTDLIVTAITAETIQDSLGNTPISAVPATNIATGSAIVVDTTAPVFTVTSPTSNSTINNLTTSSSLSYSIGENLTSGTILISLVSGDDALAPHTCTLTGTNLNAGTYANFNTTNCTEGAITLTNQSVYNFTFTGQDSQGNSNIQTVTGVEFNPTATAITISAVNSVVDSNSATITFTTSENSYGYVDYGTTEAYGKVQGNNTTTTSSHTITLEGLVYSTEYFFRPRVKSIAGDYSLGSQLTFTTEAEPAAPSAEGPTISNVRVEADSLGYDSATVMWSTDEESDGLVYYGQDLEYGSVFGNGLTTTAHSVTLPDLSPETLYYFKVRSENSEGNKTTDDNSSSAYTFSTLSGSQADQISDITLEIENMITNLAYTEEEIMTAISNIEAIAISSSGPSENIENNTDVTISWKTNKDSKGKVIFKQEDQDSWTTLEEEILTESGYTQDHEALIKNLETQTSYEYYVVSTSILGNQVTSDINTFTTGETPKISNIMVNATSLNEATISWTTNSITTSILEYGTSTSYGNEQEETSSTSETNQAVLLENLEAGQEYHFRIRGIDEDQENITSSDNTFTTSALPEISNVEISEPTTETVTISWETNSNTDSLVEYSFKDQEEGASQGVLEATTEHSITLEKLVPGSSYQATVFSKDQFGNQAQSELFTFQTQQDNNPPQIQNISSDTTMYPGKDLKIQTVISWVTNKDSQSALAFRKGAGNLDEGLGEKLQEIVKEEAEENLKTKYNEWTIVRKPALTKNHLFVLTEFEPASVYQYKVISIDSRGNSSISKDFSFLTPTKQESIFDLIIANFEETFGWVKNIR